MGRAFFFVPGFIGMDDRRLPHVLMRLLYAGCQRGAEQFLALADGTHAEVDLKDVLQQALHQPFAQSVSAAQGANE